MALFDGLFKTSPETCLSALVLATEIACHAICAGAEAEAGAPRRQGEKPGVS